MPLLGQVHTAIDAKTILFKTDESVMAHLSACLMILFDTTKGLKSYPVQYHSELWWKEHIKFFRKSVIAILSWKSISTENIVCAGPGYDWPENNLRY